MNESWPISHGERTLMTFAPPILPQRLTHEPEKATVKLSSVSDTLNVSIPDSAEIPPSWYVYLILGVDAQSPDWTGPEEPTGVWDDASDDAVKLTGIELQIPKAELKKYLNKQVKLRYKFADESSMEPCSEPLLFRIEG